MWSKYGDLHPTDLNMDDPPSAGAIAFSAKAGPGRYEGSVTLQSENRDQITRRFVLVVDPEVKL